MKKNIILFVVLLCMPLIANAETNEFTFKNYGGNLDDTPRKAIVTNDGGYVIAGNTLSTNISGNTLNGTRAALIVKYDQDGKIEWQKNYGGSSHESFFDVVESEDGGLIAVGYSSSEDAPNLTSLGGDDALVVKYDKNGNFLWASNFGYNMSDRFTKVLPTADGGIIAVGVLGYTGFSPKTIIVKYSKDGKQEWAKELDAGTKPDAITVTSDNNYTLAYHTEDEDWDYVTTHIMKLKADGTVIWNKEFTDIYYFTAINSTENGGSVLIANNASGSFLLTVNNDGELEKQIKYTGQYSASNNKFNSIETTKDGGYIVAGAANSQGIVVKFDKNGTLKWEQSFGGSGVETFVDLALTPTEEVIVAGTYKSTDIAGITNNGSSDIIIITYDKDGKKELEQTYGGTAADNATNVIRVSNNKYVIVGDTSSSSIGGVTTKGKKDMVISELTFSYEVTKEETENGTYEIVEENGQAKVSITPEEGYELESIIIKDSFGNTLEYTEKDGVYYFEVIDDVTVSVTYKEIPEEIVEEEVKNPNTKVGAILLMLVIATWAAVLMSKKSNGIKRFS